MAFGHVGSTPTGGTKQRKGTMFPDGKCVVEGTPPQFFFPKGQRVGRSQEGMSVAEQEEEIEKSYCSACPRQDECSDYAISMGENHGVYGYSSAKRKQIRAARNVKIAS